MMKGKKILVVGAGGLLGSALVKDLLEKGAEVIAADINLELLDIRLQKLSVSLQSTRLTSMKVDLTDATGVKEMFRNIKGLTGAVNCSYPRNSNYGKHFGDVTLDDFNENVSLNLGSAFLFMQQCSEYFKRTMSPFSLVNISSVYGVVAPKFEIYSGTSMTMPVEYSAVKAGLLHLTKYVTNYIKNSDFRINSVSPGGLYDSQPQEFLESYRAHTFGKGMLAAEDILGAITFLLSDDSKYINAQNIIVDDGFTG